MGRLIGGLLDNESPFGRIMLKCFLIIGANILFAVISIPVITIYPGIIALYSVMLRHLHSGNVTNPWKAFIQGFKENFRQGMISSLAIMALGAFLLIDIRICKQAGGFFAILRYILLAMLLCLVILAVYLAPVMASFSDTLPNLLRNALFFASRRPLKIIPAVLLYAVPVTATVLDQRMRPLYGFLWVTCLAGLIVMMESELLIRDIEQYLPEHTTEETEDIAQKDRPKEKSQRALLKEMKKLDQ
jgi:uncharacterized membrane protein YesL